MINPKNIIITVLALVLLAGVFYIIDTNTSKEDILQNESGTTFKNTNLQDKQIRNDEITNARRNIITETVKEVSPAVVGINVIEIQEYRDPFSSFFDDPFFRQFFGDRGKRSREIKELGSGYIISSDGYIITNDHVAGNATRITVSLTNGVSYNASLIGSDYISDIALLKIEGNNFPYMKLGDSDDIIIGEWVIALGNPFGLFEINDQPTVTVG